jgi:hypothetical protein
VDLGESVLHPTAAIGYTLVHQRSTGLKQVLLDAEQALVTAKRDKA